MPHLDDFLRIFNAVAALVALGFWMSNFVRFSVMNRAERWVTGSVGLLLFVIAYGSLEAQSQHAAMGNRVVMFAVSLLALIVSLAADVKSNHFRGVRKTDE